MLINWLTLAVSGVAAGTGAYAVTLGKRAERRDKEAERAWEDARAASERAATAERDRAIWERDKVNEHYSALLRACHAFVEVLVHDVQPIYATTPVGDDAAAWSALSAAHTTLLNTITETTVIARKHVGGLLLKLVSLDVTAMVPIARDTGTPPIAHRRFLSEYHLLLEINAALPWAMRMDLGLDPDNPIELENWAPPQDRRLHGTTEDLRLFLREYGIVGWDNAPTTTYELPDFGPRLFRENPAARATVAAMMTITPRAELDFMLLADLPQPAKHQILQGAVRFVESGLRDGPLSRDLPNGGRVVTWTRDGNPLNGSAAATGSLSQ